MTDDAPRRPPVTLATPAALATLAAEETGYEVRTLEAARDLATLIAAAHPDPDRVVIGLTELLINAVEHGNLGIPYEEKASLLDRGAFDAEIARRLCLAPFAARRVQVTLRRDATTLATRIEDEGQGFDWRPYLDYDPERALDANGHGIAIACGMSFDEVTYQGRGNVVVAVVRLDIEHPRLGEGADDGADAPTPVPSGD